MPNYYLHILFYKQNLSLNLCFVFFSNYDNFIEIKGLIKKKKKIAQYINTYNIMILNN